VILAQVLNWWMDVIDGYEKNGLAMKWISDSYYSKKLQAILKEKDSKNQEYYT
jgi:hypothetical protein